jgi:lipase chaperone LimK
MKRRHAALFIAGGLAALAGVLWITDPESAATTGFAASTGERASAYGSATAEQLIAATATPGPGTSKQARTAFLAGSLRFKLEDMLLEAGEAATPAALKQQLAALASKYFSAEQMAQALEMVGRYVDYRVALGEIKPPSNPSDPDALRAVLDARQRLREKHFSPDEYAALFAQEEELDRFTLARLEIERNPDLTASQKAAAIRDAERDLSDSQRAARADAVAHVAVAAQSAAFEASGVGEHERYAERRKQYGDAAAQQLAQLDREERDWQVRLDAYAAGKARNEPAAQLNRLRQQLFTPEEQLRIDAALALRQQASTSPAKP